MTDWPDPVEAPASEMTTGLAADLMLKKALLAHGCQVELRFGTDWILVVNGTGAEVQYQPEPAGEIMGAPLGPWEFGFWRNGWFLGALRPYMDGDCFAERGVLVGGEKTDREIRAAIKKELAL